jgi:acyl dehydratase
VTLHQPLPSFANLVSDARVTHCFDKGEGRGAVIYTQTNVRIKETGENLCTTNSAIFARGDGGFGGTKGVAHKSHPLPARAPDQVCEIKTRVDQALLYRLCRDRNQLHSDPETAIKAGFDKPILHGLCTYGIACQAVLKTLCEYDHTRITGFDVRFSAPVFPGETVITSMWQDGNIVSFKSRVKERDQVVLNHGKCILKD